MTAKEEFKKNGLKKGKCCGNCKSLGMYDWNERPVCRFMIGKGYGDKEAETKEYNTCNKWSDVDE